MYGEGIEFVATPTRLAMQVSLGIGSLYDLPVGTVLAVTHENLSHIYVSPFRMLLQILLEK
jgi:hypothetical protein